MSVWCTPGCYNSKMFEHEIEPDDEGTGFDITTGHGHLSGYYDDGSLSVTDVTVAEEHQGEGIGGALVDEAFRLADEQGVPQVEGTASHPALMKAILNSAARVGSTVDIYDQHPDTGGVWQAGDGFGRRHG
jgi:GNAT superfamily N-acetyltransferase